jgi:hypothetical protein
MARTTKLVKAGKNVVANVRVVDQYAGTDGARVDRMLSNLQNTHSQVRVLCSDQFTYSTSTGASQANYSGSTIRATDDFVSFVAQFETYRIQAIRFDIYDIAPNTSVVAVWSTFHDVAEGYYPSNSFSFANVVDGPDSQVLSPGVGKTSFTWVAKGTVENSFQSTDAVSASNLVQDYGGLRFAAAGSVTGIPKYMIVMKAVVDFRGRQ